MAIGISREQMIEKLEAHGFPSDYVFKFIVPADAVPLVLKVVPEGEITKRPSKNGKYISVSCKAFMKNAASAVDVYEEAHTIPGIIAL